MRRFFHSSSCSTFLQALLPPHRSVDPGDGVHIDAGGSSLTQEARTLLYRGSRGIDIVDEQQRFVLATLWCLYSERSTNIVAALHGTETHLWPGVSRAH